LPTSRKVRTRRNETALALTGMLFAGLGAPAKTTLFAGVPQTALGLAR
jgi:hypothetical protein